MKKIYSYIGGMLLTTAMAFCITSQPAHPMTLHHLMKPAFRLHQLMKIRFR